MELTKRCDEINKILKDQYGIDTVSGLAIFRVVWAEEQMEHRKGYYEDFTPSGIFIRGVEEVRYTTKYPYISEVYVLERLVVVPIRNENDLPAVKVSYEPLHSFRKNPDAQPPSIAAAQFLIDAVLAAQGHGNLIKYKDPLAGLNTPELIEAKNKELQALQDELFGNETDTGDALAHKEAITVPRNYERIH